MDKDYDLKRDPHYQTATLRERVNQSIKRLRDESEELKGPLSKTVTKTGFGGHYKDQDHQDNRYQ